MMLTQTHSEWRMHQECFHVRTVSSAKRPARHPQAHNYRDFSALFQYKLLQLQLLSPFTEGLALGWVAQTVGHKSSEIP